MRSPINVNIADRQIIINSGFAKRARKFDTQEYHMLKICRNDYPGFEVIIRAIRKNNNKECYRGLTYEYMENYILRHSDNPKKSLAEFAELKLISKCHSIRYPVIKKWFLNNYPEIVEFGMPEMQQEDKTKIQPLVA